MPSEPQGRPSPKQKADDAISIFEDPPSIKKVDFVPVETAASPSGPIPNDETWERAMKLYNKVLCHRSRIIGDRVAAAAALEYNPTDLAENVALAKEMIMAGIKNAMVWTSTFDDTRDSPFAVKFRYDVHPGTVQVLRVLFPGIGIPDVLGMNKGWNFNYYSPREFRNIMGTEMIARVGSSFAEFSSLVKVHCFLYHGFIAFYGGYRELRDYGPA